MDQVLCTWALVKPIHRFLPLEKKKCPHWNKSTHWTLLLGTLFLYWVGPSIARKTASVPRGMDSTRWNGNFLLIFWSMWKRLYREIFQVHCHAVPFPFYHIQRCSIGFRSSDWEATEEHWAHCHVHETSLGQYLLCDLVHSYAGSSR